MDTQHSSGWIQRIRGFLRLHELPPLVRRVVVSVVGVTVLLIGVALIVLPGPAFLVIPVGLVILGTEFAWARRLVRKARVLANSARNKVTRQHSAAKPQPKL